MSDLRQAEISGFYVGIRYTGSLKWIESRSSVKLIETFDWNCRTCVAWVHNQTEMWRWSHTTAAEVLFVKHVVSMDTDVVIVRLWRCSLTPAVILYRFRFLVACRWNDCLKQLCVCLVVWCSRGMHTLESQNVCLWSVGSLQQFQQVSLLRLALL